MHQHGWNAFRSAEAPDFKSSCVAAQQKSCREVGLGSNSVNSSGPRNSVNEFIRDHKIVEHLPVAGRYFGCEDGSPHHSQNTRSGQHGRFNVPVAADDARAFEATNDGTHVVAHQLVLVVHADRVLEVDRYQVEAALGDGTDPGDGHSVRN